MKLFKDLKKGATEASEKAKVMIEINKLKIQISQNEKEIDDEFRKIAETVFDMFKAGNMGEMTSSIIESCDMCLSKEEKNKELEIEIRKFKNERECSNCGATVKLDIKFCPSCGYKFEITEKYTDLQSEKILEVTIVKCSKCGVENEKDAKFCGGCGEEIE